MTAHEAFQASIDAMQAVIDLEPVTDSQLRLPTPCTDFTVEALAEHIIDTHNLFVGATGGNPTTTQGSLSDRHRAAGAASVSRWTSRGIDGTIDLGGNELPAVFGRSLHTLETYIHAWDLATSLGRPFEPAEQLTDQMYEFAQSFITDDVRGDGGPYAAAITIADNAGTLDRLIALSGRDPVAANQRDPIRGRHTSSRTKTGRSVVERCGSKR